MLNMFTTPPRKAGGVLLPSNRKASTANELLRCLAPRKLLARSQNQEVKPPRQRPPLHRLPTWKGQVIILQTRRHHFQHHHHIPGSSLHFLHMSRSTNMMSFTAAKNNLRLAFLFQQRLTRTESTTNSSKVKQPYRWNLSNQTLCAIIRYSQTIQAKSPSATPAL